jgi:hypothetical protein
MAYVVFAGKDVQVTNTINNFRRRTFVIKKFIGFFGIGDSFSPVVLRDDANLLYVRIFK